MQIIQESIIEKAKDFISKHKGKLAAAAAIGGAGFLGYKLGHSDANNTKNITNLNVTIYRSNKIPHADAHNTQSNFGSSKIINTDDDF